MPKSISLKHHQSAKSVRERSNIIMTVNEQFETSFPPHMTVF